ncbi:hypothetical protein [Streptomyces sp. 6-11-2]|nr:hypothetical protein [Streptomyces sp. 6-11-2]GED90484.1 hypothetical protein TNCT6_75690 [Streptomyces sp. 6-11-2]
MPSMRAVLEARQKLVAELHDRLRGAVRGAEGREEEASAAVVDSQSV